MAVGINIFRIENYSRKIRAVLNTTNEKSTNLLHVFNYINLTTPIEEKRASNYETTILL